MRKLLFLSRRAVELLVRIAKRAANIALRKHRPGTKRARFLVQAAPMDLRAGIDPAGFNKLVDDLDVNAFIESRDKQARDHP